MGRGNRKKKKNGARSVVPHQPFSTTIAPATLNQQSLSLSQQNTVILSPNATISELQSINAFNESDKEWVKAYIEKEQAHRHALEDVREQNRKDSDDRLIQIAGRSQMIGAFGGVIVTLGLAGAAVYFVSRDGMWLLLERCLVHCCHLPPHFSEDGTRIKAIPVSNS